jgi:isopentenyl diphosphate isomerase/L-lactate dehydrogenase-like FMN-dependent dehydrogenase
LIVWRAKGKINTQGEAVDNVITPFLSWATVAGFSEALFNPLFVLGHRLPLLLAHQVLTNR